MDVHRRVHYCRVRACGCSNRTQPERRGIARMSRRGPPAKTRAASILTSGALPVAAAVAGGRHLVEDRLVARGAPTVGVVDLVLAGTSHGVLAFCVGVGMVCSHSKLLGLRGNRRGLWDLLPSVGRLWREDDERPIRSRYGGARDEQGLSKASDRYWIARHRGQAPEPAGPATRGHGAIPTPRP